MATSNRAARSSIAHGPLQIQSNLQFLNSTLSDPHQPRSWHLALEIPVLMFTKLVTQWARGDGISTESVVLRLSTSLVQYVACCLVVVVPCGWWSQLVFLAVDGPTCWYLHCWSQRFRSGSEDGARREGSHGAGVRCVLQPALFYFDGNSLFACGALCISLATGQSLVRFQILWTVSTSPTPIWLILPFVGLGNSSVVGPTIVGQLATAFLDTMYKA